MARVRTSGAHTTYQIHRSFDAAKSAAEEVAERQNAAGGDYFPEVHVVQPGKGQGGKDLVTRVLQVDGEWQT